MLSRFGLLVLCTLPCHAHLGGRLLCSQGNQVLAYVLSALPLLLLACGDVIIDLSVEPDDTANRISPVTDPSSVPLV